MNAGTTRNHGETNAPSAVPAATHTPMTTCT
jgi:hypothetical protein